MSINRERGRQDIDMTHNSLRDEDRRNTQQKDGLFISRLSRHTRATDFVSYIRNEANLNLRCDPVPTKYDFYRSYYIHAHPRHHGLLLKPGMWPKNVIVRPYSSD